MTQINEAQFRKVKVGAQWQVADFEGKALPGFGTFTYEDDVDEKVEQLNGKKPLPAKKKEPAMTEGLEAVIGYLINGQDQAARDTIHSYFVTKVQAMVNEGKLSRDERASMIEDILDAMQTSYEESGDEGDFDDARRYYRDDASDDEIRADYKRWVKKPVSESKAELTPEQRKKIQADFREWSGGFDPSECDEKQIRMYAKTGLDADFTEAQGLEALLNH